MLLAPYVCFIFLVKLKKLSGHLLGKKLIRLTKCFHGIGTWFLVWFFPTSGFWFGTLLLIAPLPDLCLLVSLREGLSEPEFYGDLFGPPGSNWCFSFAPEVEGYSVQRDFHLRAANSICESLSLIH